MRSGIHPTPRAAEPVSHHARVPFKTAAEWEKDELDDIIGPIPEERMEEYRRMRSNDKVAFQRANEPMTRITSLIPEDFDEHGSYIGRM